MSVLPFLEVKMNNILAILWDIDGTLLNFHKAERTSLIECLKNIGFNGCDEEFITRYRELNLSYWKRLEKGEVSMEQLVTERFRVLAKREGINIPDVAAFNEEYQQGLGRYIYINDDSLKLIEHLKPRFKQYAITNGTPVAQHAKLNNSGLIDLLEGAFISKELGYDKPRKEFFDIVINEIGIKRENCVVIGDSLSSDIKGANNAGIPAIWYNPEGIQLEQGLQVYAQIKNLWEIEELI